MIPYLTKYNKKWQSVEPTDLKTNTMKMVQALYDTIINEFEKQDALQSELDEVFAETEPVKPAIVKLEEPTATLQPVEEVPVMMSPIEFLNQPVPSLMPTPVVDEAPKKVAVTVVAQKSMPGISKHSKEIHKDPLQDFYRDQIKNNRGWFDKIKHTRELYFAGKIDKANAIMHYQFAVTDMSGWLHPAVSQVSEEIPEEKRQ